MGLFKAVSDNKVAGLIGCSGSFESLAEMIEKDSNSPSRLKEQTEYTFKLNDLEQLHTKLIQSTSVERSVMKGLVPYRIETIPLASTFINYIVKKFSLHKIRLSTYSLREGVISELKVK